MIEQAKFTYSPLGKALEKQTKTIQDQRKTKMKAIEDHGKHLVDSNELAKTDFNISSDSISIEEQKKIFNELVEERFFEFQD